MHVKIRQLESSSIFSFIFEYSQIHWQCFAYKLVRCFLILMCLHVVLVIIHCFLWTFSLRENIWISFSFSRDFNANTRNGFVAQIIEVWGWILKLKLKYGVCTIAFEVEVWVSIWNSIWSLDWKFRWKVSILSF